MNIKLDPMQGYTKDGKFDVEKALIDAGVKAAVCFKEPLNGQAVSPWEIRDNEDDSTLIKRAVNTILSQHNTPSEQQHVSLEITNIPKALCMVLNNQHQYNACERSLRYTQVEENEYITEKEVLLYNKWMEILINKINNEYYDFYRKISKSDKEANSKIKKLAQENARYMISVFMPTTLTYTVPLAQLNKICAYMQKSIQSNNNSEFEKKLLIYYEDFINQLKKLKVAITKADIYDILKKYDIKIPRLEDYKDNQELIYNDGKNINLSLFANKNKFSGINLPSEYGVNISYNHESSLACLAQEQRHRTIYCEMQMLDKDSFFIPKIIENDEKLKLMWLKDILSVKEYIPQGTLVKVNTSGLLYNIINYVAKERCCESAQYEIYDLYTNKMLPKIYENLKNDELKKEVAPYIKKLRCMYTDYRCPRPCGHARIERDL